MKIAAIDIGSNTILMQLAEYNKATNSVVIIAEHHGIARLSKNLNQTNIISSFSMQLAENILKDYYEICKKQNVDKIVAVGTSAMREAKNVAEVKQKLEAIFENNCKIQVITGEEESMLSFKGATSDIKDAQKQCIVLDIGGGSTEIIIGNKDKISYSVSIPIGVVKLTEKLNIKQPVSVDMQASIQTLIQKQLSEIKVPCELEENAEFIAVSGTPAALAQISLGLKSHNNNAIHNYIFTMQKLNYIQNIVLNSTIEDLICKYGIHESRADVLSAGVMILLEILIKFNVTQVRASANGLRHGVLLAEIGY